MAQELGALAAAIKARKEAAAAAAGTDQPAPKPKDEPKKSAPVEGLKKALPKGKDENYYDPKKRSAAEIAEDEEMRRKELELRQRNRGK